MSKKSLRLSTSWICQGDEFKVKEGDLDWCNKQRLILDEGQNKFSVKMTESLFTKKTWFVASLLICLLKFAQGTWGELCLSPNHLHQGNNSKGTTVSFAFA